MKLFNKTIDRQLFKQYSLGSDLSKQEVVVKIFNPQGAGSWYILNSDPQDPDYLWAIVDLGYGAEVGSVSRSDLETYRGRFGLGFERDLGFDPINAEELYKGLRQGKFYADGGGVDDYSDLYGQEVMALKNAKNQAKSTKYDYVVYQNAEGEISFARKNDFNRFFDKDECKILYTIDEKGNVNKIKSYANGGQISGDEVTLSKGYGYYDLSKYAYGNDFKRFTEPTVGKFIKGTVKTGGQVRVLLNDGREIITDKQAIDLPTYDDKDELYQQNKHLFSFGYADGGNLSRDRKFVNYSQDYEVKYSKGKNRKGYGFEDGGNLRQSLEELLKQDVVFLKFDSGRAYDTFNRLDIPFVNVHDYDFNHYCIIETKNLEKVLDNVRKGVRVVKKKFSSDDLGFDYKGRKSFADGGEVTEEDYEKRLQYLKMMKNNERSSFGKYNIDKEIRQINTILEHRKNFKNSYADGGDLEKFSDNQRMIMNKNVEVEHHHEELEDILEDKVPVPAWVVAKMETATKNLSDITHYLDGQKELMEDGKEEDDEDDEEDEEYGEFDYSNLDDDEDEMELDEIENKEVVEPINVTAETKAELTKKFTDDALGNLKGFLKGMEEIELRDDYTFDYKNEQFETEPIINSDENGVSNAVFTIFDGDGEEVGEVAYSREGGKQKFTANSEFFGWDRAKFEDGGFMNGVYAKGGIVDVEKVNKADEIYREHNRERKEKGIENFSKESVALWNEKYDNRLQKLKLTFEEKNALNPKKWYADGGYFDGAIPNVSTYMSTYAKGGEIAKGEILGLKKNILGTTDVEMKITGMRKPQRFSVYPIGKDDASSIITIQSETRIGQINLIKGVGVMSQSHSNGAYFVHLQMDKLTPFTISESDLENIKSHIFKTAGANVGSSVVKSDNSGASRLFADGGYFDEWRKGSTVSFSTKKQASERLSWMKNRNGTESDFRNLRVEKTSDGYAVKFDFKDKMENGGFMNNIYAEGGSFDDEYDGIAYAKTKGKESVNWDKELREYVGSEYSKLTQREKEEIISDMQRDWDRSNSYAKGGVTYFNNDNQHRLGRPSGSFEKEIYAKVKDRIDADDFVGSFGWKISSGKKANIADGFLYKLDDYDQNLIKNLNLKQGEKVFRYVNRTTAIGGMMPFIKINIEKALLYFPVSNDNDDIIFETRGITPLWINLIEGSFADGGFMNNIYAEGGQIRVGDRYKFYWTDTEGNKGYTIREVVKQNVTSGKDFRTKVMIMKVVESSMPETVGRMEEEYKPSFKKAIERGMEISMQEGKPRMADDDYATGGVLDAKTVKIGDWLQKKDNKAKAKVFDIKKDKYSTEIFVEDLYENKVSRPISLEDWKKIAEPTRELERIKKVFEEMNYAKGGGIENDGYNLKDINGKKINVGDTVRTTQPSGGLMNPANPEIGIVEKTKDAFGNDALQIKYRKQGTNYDRFILLNGKINEIVDKSSSSFEQGGFMDNVYAKGGSLEDKLTKLENKKSDLESKLLDAQLKANEKWNNMGWGSGMRKSKLNLSTSREDSLKERIKLVEKEIEQTKEDMLLKKPKYILKADIKTVTVKRNGKEATYEGADVLNGANVLAKGGDLTSKANYVAKRDVVSVELKDGSKIKPVNGYWVKKGAEPINSKQEFTYKDLPKDGSSISINAPAMSGIPAIDLVLKYDSKNFRFDVYKDGVKKDMIGEKEVLNNLNSGIYVLSNKLTPTSSAKSPSKVGQTYIKKGVYGWSATTNIDDFNDYDWRISTIKTSSGQLITSAKAGKNEQGDGYTTFKYTMYQDPYHTLEVSKPSRLTEKVVAEQHAKGVEKFKKFMETGMFKGGGKISNFDKLSAKVAKQYEGKPVKNQYQEEYGKYYSREEAQEVGDKVAGKVKAMQTDKKAFGGLFKNVKDLAKAKPKYPNLEGKQVPLKSGEFVMVFTQDDNTLSVMNVGKIGSGVKLRNIDISEVDMTNFKAGGQTGTKKMNAGTETMKQANDLAKKIRMDGESWLDAKKRAFAELRKQNEAKNN